ncbi:ABC transporter ATP-binding protein [Ruicaihuangia caeni]|uniref:ABC transporter ATP-binding protein n=1 Tax=Ruicaihuangia caeni TaxID=3042517 RepID=A0AAW6T1Q9_9MICO|nr:ABC transporter ATP-binding protein [Klugiella sp. YN-L-19]MDI2097760.1 ABC transporter ATP-binding protein [Klugiella sp. YN-L-19]
MTATVRGARVVLRGFGWRHATRRAPALSSIDLVIEPGERVLLLGASGSGKSTLLQALAGLLGDDEGDAGGSLEVEGGTRGLVLQDPESQVILSRVGDDVAFGLENLAVPRQEIWPRVRAALDEVGLDVPLDRPTSALSGGQQQRLALAGVLAMRPALLLLDEPTANLDPEGVQEVRRAVGEVVAQHPVTLVVVEHRVELWHDLVDRVIVIAGGGVAIDAPAATVFTDHADQLCELGIWTPASSGLNGSQGAARPMGPGNAPRALGDHPPLLAADDLTVSRTPGAAVRGGIHAEVRAGRCLAITGPNGSGKSTTGLTLAGLLPPEDGLVQASEGLRQGASAQPHRWRSRELLTRVGVVFQDPEHQFLSTTVRAELEVGLKALRMPKSEADARVTELLKRLRLEHLAEANPFSLSGGEKRRLSVATMLATRPQVLVLDEPTFGQDAATWRELVSLLRELLDAGTAVVAITHDERFVAALADDVLHLDRNEGSLATAGAAIDDGSRARP